MITSGGKTLKQIFETPIFDSNNKIKVLSKCALFVAALILEMSLSQLAVETV